MSAVRCRVKGCDKPFSDADALETHKAIAHPDPVEPVIGGPSGALLARARRNNERGKDLLKLLPTALRNGTDWLAAGVRSSDGPKVSGGTTAGLDGQVIDSSPDACAHCSHDMDDHPSPSFACSRCECPKGEVKREWRNRRDNVALDLQGVGEELAIIEAATGRLERRVQRLTGLDMAEARRLAEASDMSRGSFCVNPACKAWITGIGEDRARDGRCDPCRKYRDRRKAEGHPLEDRPHRLVHREPLQGCVDCDRIWASA